MAEIFLSYSREDEARIKGLVSEFELQGWSVFWDRRIPAGETWRSHIGSALQEARCIVVAWSKYSIESQWVAEEADEGKARNVLVPVLLDRVQPPRGFREIQAADISEWRLGQESEHFTALIGDIQRMLRKETKPIKDEPPLRQPISIDGPSRNQEAGRSNLGRRIILVVLLSVLTIGVFAYCVVIQPNPKPQPSPTPKVVGSTASWLIVAGSFGRNDNAAAVQRQLVLKEAGLDAAIIDTNEYLLLTPNLWIVAIGPFESRDAANAALISVKARVPDAYVKKAR